MHFYPCSYFHFFPSFLFAPSSIRDKKGESIVIFICLLCAFSGGEILSLVHILRGRNSIREMIISRGRKLLYEKTSFCFTLFVFLLSLLYLMGIFFPLISLWCFEFSLVSMLYCSHYCVFMLDMHTSFCYCALMIVCLDDNLHCWVIIIVISIWLFCVRSSYTHMFHITFTWLEFTCYFILVFYYLLYAWVSNVFCASVSGNKCFVPSSSQVLDLGVSEFFQCFQTYI